MRNQHTTTKTYSNDKVCRKQRTAHTRLRWMLSVCGCIKIEHIFTAPDHFVTKSSCPTSSDSSGHFESRIESFIADGGLAIAVVIILSVLDIATNPHGEEREKETENISIYIYIYDLNFLFLLLVPFSFAFF